MHEHIKLAFEKFAGSLIIRLVLRRSRFSPCEFSTTCLSWFHTAHNVDRQQVH
jgi:hypothetical protein